MNPPSGPSPHGSSNTFEAHLVVKQIHDERNRREFVRKAKAAIMAELEVIRREGAVLSGVKIELVEEGPNRISVVLSAERTVELDERDLESVAGGGGATEGFDWRCRPLTERGCHF